jgi:hypothetical protein
MTEEDFMDLVDKVICGEITEAERAELEAYLAENEEARMLYEQTVETCDLLGKVKDLEPPPDLEDRIMRSVDTERYHARRVPEPRPSIWRTIFQPRFRLAYAFSLGIIVGLLVYSQIGGFGIGGYRAGSGRIDVTHLYGTIAGKGVEGVREIGCLRVKHSDLSGEITMLRVGELLVIAPRLAPGSDLGVRIDFDPGAIRFEGFGSPEGPGVRVEVEEGYVRSFGTGDGRYVMSITGHEARPADLGVKVIRAGEIVYQGEFRVPVAD